MIGVYVKYKGETYRLDLFQDETIDITSSQQDINDISKVFTDYSQNFSIPSTPNNNKVFKHWYENAVQDGFDDTEKLNCFIELNGNSFRSGKLKLESATVVNGVCKSYAVSFLGNLVSLKDKFKDDKLINVTHINDIIGFEYTDANVVDSVVNENDADIAFPLIASSRAWTYEDGASTDISISGNSIDYKELFPAVRVKSVFDAIEQKYGLNFVGDFLDDKRFTELFIYCKNSEKIKFDTSIYDVDFLSENGNTPPNFTVDLTNNAIQYSGYDQYDTDVRMEFSIGCDANTEWTLYIYYNGVANGSISDKGSTPLGINILGSPGNYSFKFKANGVVNNALIGMASSGDEDPGIGGGEYNRYGYVDLNLFGGGVLPINILMPDIKVTDFFSGILKMFNLTCYSENGVDFILEPLIDWYNDGRIVDITRFCEPSYEVNKTVTYKKIIFKYEKSESILNNAFYEAFQRYYGDLEYPKDTDPQLNKEGEEYKVELPFENLLHQKFSGTRLHVGYAINKDLKPYVPKPILLYKWGNISTDVSFYLEGTERTSYNAFGQELEYADEVFYTLNWGLENSSLLDGVVENTLYHVYYETYIDDVFYTSARKINIKGIFNTNIMTGLRLNDRVIIRDKRYKINKLGLNLNKQTFDLELITDI